MILKDLSAASELVVVVAVVVFVVFAYFSRKEGHFFGLFFLQWLSRSLIAPNNPLPLCGTFSFRALCFWLRFSTRTRNEMASYATPSKIAQKYSWPPKPFWPGRGWLPAATEANTEELVDQISSDYSHIFAKYLGHRDGI